MILEILPSSLYKQPNIEVALKNKGSSIIFKSLSESLENKKMYLSSVAILLVLKGEQIIQNYDGSKLTVKENEIVILPRDLYVVSDFIAEQGSFEALIFFIDELILNRFIKLCSKNLINKKLTSKVLKAEIGDQVTQYVRSLNDIYKGAENNEALLELKLLEFLLLLEQNVASQALLESLVAPIKKRSIGEFMEENYLSNLSISDYAALTGRSDSTFSRDFKRLFKTTPKKWLIAKRLDKSHELLRTTQLNVTEVAVEVGYDNVSHFISAYKKAYGVTPKSTLKNRLG